MPTLLSHTPLLLDASCVTSLYASGQMGPILSAYAAPIGVADVLHPREMLYIWGGPDQDVRRHKIAVNLWSLIAAGALVEFPFKDVDVEMAVNLAAQGFDNSECVTVAVAYRLGWGVGIDDIPAWRRIAALLPQVSLVSTSQLLKYWVDTQCIVINDARAVLQSMRRRGGYRFSKYDGLADWLQRLI